MLNANQKTGPKGPSDYVDGKARRKFIKLDDLFRKARGSMRVELGPCCRNGRDRYVRWDCCRAHRNLNFIASQWEYWARQTHFSTDYQVCSDGWRARVGVRLSDWTEKHGPFPYGKYPPLPVRF